jgi:hypothetical protein
MQDLSLIAFDAEDLAIVSAHLQDALVKRSDMTFLPREKRFALYSSRFDWTALERGADAPAGLVTLTFSGGAAVRLEVECLEAELRDIGPRAPVDDSPGHAEADASKVGAD